MSQRTTTIWLLGLLVITLLAFALRIWGLNGAGETWDEVAYYDAAHHYYQNVVAQRWSDSSAWTANHEHPALGKWLYLLPSISAFKVDVVDFNPGRLVSAAVGALTVLVTILAARRLYLSFDRERGRQADWIGLGAGLITALSPPLIAFSRVLGLDSPTTFFFTLTVWLFLESIGASESRSENKETNLNTAILNSQFSIPAWGWHSATLVAFGLALGTRFSSALLWPLLATIGIVAGIENRELGIGNERSNSQFSILNSVRSLARTIVKPSTIGWILLYLAVPVAVVYLSWPWLWVDTANHWQQTIGHWSPVSGFFLGVIQFPPVSYYVFYYLVSFPGLVVVASLFFLARTLVRGSKADWLVTLWILAIFGFALYGLRQGGIRYLLQLAPPLAIGVSALIVELTERIANHDRLAWILPSIFIAYLSLHAVWAQPYQLDYYNELSGGTKAVAAGKMFQVGWWGEGIDQAVDWLNANAARNASLSFTATPDRAQRRLRKDFHHTAGLPDFILTNNAFTWYRSEYPGLLEHYTPVYLVTVRGATLAGVWERVE